MGTSQSAFPYTVEEALPGFQSSWELHPGARKEGGGEVSVFKLDKARASPGALAAAQNALKRMKTLRHPCILAYVDGGETDTEVFVVTERVVPLSHEMRHFTRVHLAENAGAEAELAWGVHSVARALGFLNGDCGVVHGNVGPEGVFVTKAGEWRLGGFDLAYDHAAGPSHEFRSGDTLLPTKYKSPERASQNWQGMAAGPAHATDSYSLGALVYDALTGGEFTRAEELQAPPTESLPRSIANTFRRLVAERPRDRLPAQQFLSCPFFNSDYVRAMSFLEELALKEPRERAEFFSSLTGRIEGFPKAGCMHAILPALTHALELSGGSSGATATVLPPILRIGVMLDPEQYKRFIVPSVVSLFACNDRATRVQLLDSLGAFGEHLDEDLVNKSIFDHVSTGFTDTSPIVREATVKAMLHLASKLNKRNLNERLLTALGRLQADPEPGIRTNTTICLGRIAELLEPKTQARSLFNAFQRSLRDPFPFVRLYGLKALSATKACYPPEAVATKLMPSLCPLLLDQSADVREQALSTLESFIAVTRRAAEAMTDEEAVRAAEAAAEGSEVGSASASGGSGSAEGSGSGVMGWAMSSLATKIVGSIGSSGGTAGAAPAPTAAATAAPAPAPAPAPASAVSDEGDSDLDLDDSWGASAPAPAPAAARSTWGDDEDWGAPAPAPAPAAANSGWGDEDDWGSSVAPAPARAAARAPAPAPAPAAANSGWGDEDDWGSPAAPAPARTVAQAPAPAPAPAAANSGWGDEDDWGSPAALAPARAAARAPAPAPAPAAANSGWGDEDDGWGAPAPARAAARAPAPAPAPAPAAANSGWGDEDDGWGAPAPAPAPAPAAAKSSGLSIKGKAKAKPTANAAATAKDDVNWDDWGL